MHMMPGLFVSSDEDLNMFKKLFSDDNFKPDMLKIYPCLVTKGSELYDLWKEGKYNPYTDEEAVDLIVKVKQILPKWVRTMRIQRDIPSTLIEAGVQKIQLRENWFTINWKNTTLTVSVYVVVKLAIKNKSEIWLR